MHNHLRVARVITRLLDTSFGIGRFRFGLEPLLGMIPVIGDIFGLIFSFYLIWIGKRMNLPEREIVRMTRNVMFDFIIGLIPFFGDLTDFVYKANSRNLIILEQYVQRGTVEGNILS